MSCIIFGRNGHDPYYQQICPAERGMNMKRRPNNEKRAAAFERAFAAKERMDTTTPPDALREAYTAILGASASDDIAAYCPFCGNREKGEPYPIYDHDSIEHEPDCIVLTAKAALRQKGK
jgi:hypothetical protein